MPERHTPVCDDTRCEVCYPELAELKATFEVTSEIVNGCEVIFTAGECKIIYHPNTGYMLYRGWRTGIYKTLQGAIKAAERLEKLIAEGH